ncbi:MAG: DUF5684 domain-containing protein [Gemmataceae bacterium]
MFATALDLALWAQQFPGPRNQAAYEAGQMAGMLCQLAFLGLSLVVFVVSLWMILDKAGEPGWAAIIPVYNTMLLARICGRSEVLGVLMWVPCVNIVPTILLSIDLARVFGKEVGFAIGLILVPIVFMPMLAFGSARYVGDRGSRGGVRRRRPIDDEDDDEDDDRPRRRRLANDDDAPPRRRRLAADEDDDDPPPRRRRPADDDDEDDEPRPRRRPPSR